MTLLLQDTLVISPKTKQQVDKNTADIAKLQEKSAIAYHFKGSKPTYNDLPTTGNEVGDVWDVKDTGVNYGWTEEGTWDELGPLADLEPYLTKEEATSTYLTQADATETYPTKTELEEALKTSGSGYNALSEEQREILLADGLYNGEEVNDAEVFTQYDGKFVEFDKTLNPGGDWGTSTRVAPEYVDTRGLYGKGVISITAQNSGVSYSKDKGRTWSYVSGGPGKSFYFGAVNSAFNGEYFIANTGSGYYTSDDAITWRYGGACVGLPSSSSSAVYGFEYGNGVYVLTRQDGNTYYSTDGINWNTSTQMSGKNANCTCFANGKFVAITATKVYTSENGADWVEASKPSGDGRQCAGGNGIFVISDNNGVSSGASNKFFYSTDGGLTWKTSYTTTRHFWCGLTWCGDRFFAVSHKDNLYTYSFDGINWTEGTMPWADYWLTVTYADGDIVVTCGAGVNKENVAYVSFHPFYEYSLTDLSFNKVEVEENYALKSEIPPEIDTSKFLQNQADESWGSQSIGVGTQEYPATINQYAATAFGSRSQANGNQSVAYGVTAIANGEFSTSIGGLSQAQSRDSIAIGHMAVSTTPYSAQIGEGTNSNEGTLQFRSWTIVDANGNIPAERLGNVPTTSGNFYRSLSDEQKDVLQTTGLYEDEVVESGEIFTAENGTFVQYLTSDESGSLVRTIKQLSYTAEQVDQLLNQAYVTTSWTIPLSVADWVENKQTFTIQGLTVDSSVDLNPVVPTTREEMIKLSNAGLFISALGENSVTIECMNLPTEDLVVRLKREMTTNLVLDEINVQLAEINGV